MDWLRKLNDDPLPWLLEEDAENPGVRYFALKELVERPSSHPEIIAAQKEAMQSGPIPIILDNQEPGGFWVKPGPGYAPKYRGTVWQIIFLAQLGADGNDARVRAGCEYLLAQARDPHGSFSATGTQMGSIHCLQGNLGAALIDLGWLGDERLTGALDWLARSITGAGIAPAEERKAPVRYIRSGNSGPGFLCSANGRLPCAWGAVKAMLALSKVPEGKRTPAIEAAIQVGTDFLLGCDPALADYPMGFSEKPSLSWFRFGFPVFYVTDVLQNLEVLTASGYGQDARLESALDLLLSTQDEHGRWHMKYTYNGKIWADIEEKHKPSKWVTLRVLRVLKRAELGRG